MKTKNFYLKQKPTVPPFKLSSHAQFSLATQEYQKLPIHKTMQVSLSHKFVHSTFPLPQNKRNIAPCNIQTSSPTSTETWPNPKDPFYLFSNLLKIKACCILTPKWDAASDIGIVFISAFTALAASLLSQCWGVLWNINIEPSRKSGLLPLLGPGRSVWEHSKRVQSMKSMRIVCHKTSSLSWSVVRKVLP